MAIEKKFAELAPQLFEQDGNPFGVIVVLDTINYKVKQIVKLKSSTQPSRELQIKRILSPTQLIVGDKSKPIHEYADISEYLVSDNAQISALEQNRPRIDMAEVISAVYAEEPSVALRNVMVDAYGDYYTTQNPLPVRLSNGSVNIGSVNAELEVQLSHKSNSPDANDIGDTVNVVDGFLDKRIDKINNITYEGLSSAGTATSEAGWRITQTIEQPDGSSVSRVVGDLTYDQVWDDRVSLFPAVTPIDFYARAYEKLLPFISNANWLKLSDFDRLQPQITGDIINVRYYQNDAEIAKAEIRYIHDLDWDIKLNRYINDADGSILLNENDEPLFLD